MADSTRAATTIQPTGNAEIDGVLSGNKWAPDLAGNLTTVTFGFPSSGSLYKDQPSTRTEHVNDFQPVTDFQRENVLKYVDHIHKFSDLRLNEITGDQAGNAAIRFGWTGLNQEGAGGWADQPGNYPDAGDVWISSIGVSATTTDITEPLFIFIHELGHALGLKHPHEADGFTTILPAKYDGPEYTVLSYNMSALHKDAVSSDLTPQTWMWTDIQALQTLYGKNTTTTAGNDSYEFDLSNRHFLTIWDAGGQDTIKLINGDVNATLNLTPGTWSDVGTTVNFSTQSSANKTMQKTLFIAPDTLIEKAFGAEGNDTITGNNANNALKGNGGNDEIAGGKGNDFISGGMGADNLMGGDGDDKLFAGQGDEGNDTIAGGNGKDLIFGGGGNDALTGGAGADTLWGGAGNDLLTGGEGRDTISFAAGHGSDQITDFAIGEDILDLAHTTTKFTALSDVQAAAKMTTVGAASGVLIDTGEGDSLFLAGLSLADLTSMQFQF